LKLSIEEDEIMRKLIGLAAFVLTGSILLVNSFNMSNNVSGQILLLTVGFFYCIGLTDHFKEIQGRR